jgi:hypothetical protein
VIDGRDSKIRGPRRVSITARAAADAVRQSMSIACAAGVTPVHTRSHKRRWLTAILCSDWELVSDGDGDGDSGLDSFEGGAFQFSPILKAPLVIMAFTVPFRMPLGSRVHPRAPLSAPCRTPLPSPPERPSNAPQRPSDFDFAHSPPCDHEAPVLAFGAAGLEKMGVD